MSRGCVTKLDTVSAFGQSIAEIMVGRSYLLTWEARQGPLGVMDSNILKQAEMPPHVSASDPWQRIWMDPSKIPHLEMLWFTFLQTLKTCVFCQEAMENTFQTTRNLPLLEIRTSLVIICVDEMWWTCLYNSTTSFQKPKSTLFPQLAQQNISQRHHKSVSICKALSFLMVRILTGMRRWPFHIISPFRKHPRTEPFIQRGSKESLLHSVIPYIENQIARSCCQLLDNFLEILYDSPKSWLGFVERFWRKNRVFIGFFCWDVSILRKNSIYISLTHKDETWKWWKASALAGDLLGCNSNKNTQLPDTLTR